MSIHTVILASSSPRRKQLMAALGLNPEVVISEADERHHRGESPQALVQRLALAKAQAVADELERRGAPVVEAAIVAADTIVVAPDGASTILGKPTDAEQAREMLRLLRGRRHRVFSGLAVLNYGSGPWVEAVDTPVWMRAYDESELEVYVSSGDPLDKAGAYAIQHPLFKPIDHLEGCYTNVMGLPLCHLYLALCRLGVPVATHPLSGCPYAVEHRTCPWAGTILNGG